MPVLLKVEQTIILSRSLAKKRPKKWMVNRYGSKKGFFLSFNWENREHFSPGGRKTLDRKRLKTEKRQSYERRLETARLRDLTLDKCAVSFPSQKKGG